MKQTIEIEVPDGKKAVWKDNKVVFEDIKPQLPKTWEECCELLGEGEYINNESIICNYIPHCATSKANENILPTDLGKPMLALCQLLVCREVYRQGWKPNWSDYKTKKWVIEYINDNIASMAYMQTSKVLSFQSKEIRDQFLENFRDLIEEAGDLI